MHPIFRTVSLGLPLLIGGALHSSAEPAGLLEILAAEMNRNFSILKEKADPRPYYIAYAVTERELESVSAALGALRDKSRRHSRVLDVTVRVGEPNLDNYHPIRGDQPRFTPGVPIPVEDNAIAIQKELWLATDRTYRRAAQRLIKIRTDKQVRVAEDDASDDFSRSEASTGVNTPPALRFSADDWAMRLRKLSKAFSPFPGVLTSGLNVSVLREVKYYTDTEGTRLCHGRGFARLVMSATAKASDGMDLLTTESFEADSPADLPGDDRILAAIERVGKDLVKLTRAPVVEPYVGPAILSGRAAGVFFHEIFGHRIEGHRQKDESEGQTFAKSLGTKVLPDFLSVVFDPTRRRVGDVDLNGWYDYDDEGVKAQRVPVVEDGVLRTFLMSRTPIPGVSHSNGHGRREPGREVVSRQSNLLVESAKQVSRARLREMLIDEIRRQNKEYGFFFEQVTGGYTQTARRGIQAFKVIPLVVYRVYPDNRPDELVRGADIVGTPLASFAKILATSDQVDVFNGYCGAESGRVPVSAVSPAVLVSELEVQKAASAQDRPPLLPRPVPGGGQP